VLFVRKEKGSFLHTLLSQQKRMASGGTRPADFEFLADEIRWIQGGAAREKSEPLPLMPASAPDDDD